MLEISVIIPVYKDSEGLKRTLDSLLRQSLPLSNFEVIIINDGADPLTVELEKIYHNSHFRFIHRSPNRGSYFSRNEGLALAGAKNIAFIDADCIPDTDWLENGLSYLEKYDYVAGNIKIDYQQVNSIASYHDYLTAFPIKEYFKDYGFGVTANLFVKLNVFHTVGLFNDQLFSGGDMEFGLRVKNVPEFKSVYAESCVVIHAPRDHQMKISKIKRVRSGQQMLKQQNPEQFDFLKTSFIKRVKSFLPPSYHSFKKIYRADKRFNKFSFYLYMYRLKVLKEIS